jgi:hypothetical protein
MFAVLPAVVHEWDMAMIGTRSLEGWSAITAPVHLIHAADTRTPTNDIVELLARTYPAWHVHEVFRRPYGAAYTPRLGQPADLIDPR